MSKTQRRRAVVLALIAFFCTASYVGVDWKRFGGGFLAFLKGRGDSVLATTGGRSPGSNGGRLAAAQTTLPRDGPLPRLAPATSRHPAAGSGAGARKADDDDLFTYGNPAAGGIPPGSFIVAQDDAPPVATPGGAGAPAPAGTPEAGGEGGGDGGVTTAAPGPTGGGGGLPSSGPTTSTPAPAPTPAAPTPSGPGDPEGGLGATPPAPLPPVSAVPEASSLAMMGLGALFVAVAATRRRQPR